jgi:hypothetical protein
MRKGAHDAPTLCAQVTRAVRFTVRQADAEAAPEIGTTA